MLTISIAHDIDAARRRLGAHARQIPFAASLAINRTAQHVRDAQRKEIRDVFRQPTPYTLNAIYIKPSKKTDLRARVWLKGDYPGEPAHYLYPNIRGGSRQLKRFEYLLRSRGILPSSHFAVPGEGAKLDRYGNMSRGQIVQILGYFQSFTTVGATGNIDDRGRGRLARGTRSRRGFAYFAVQPGHPHLHPGVYQRIATAFGSAIKPVLIFVDSAHYERIYSFREVATRTIVRHWGTEFRAALQHATATAR